MLYSAVLSLPFVVNLASAVVQSPVQGPLKGFNYNPKDDAATLFPLVKNELSKIGAPGFTSARLYTALDPDSSDKPVPHPAFKAAGDSGTSVLIGLAVSLGDSSFQDELTALTAVLSDKDGKYGNLVSKNLIVGISVGNEDFYRQSIKGTPQASKQGAGSKPSTIMRQINQVRQKLSQQTPSLASKIPVGHSDTWQMWVDEEYGKQLLKSQPDQQNFKPVDFVGMQEFLYWEGYDSANTTAFGTEALAAVKSAAGKDIPVWVTETGWPVSGPKCCDAETNAASRPGLLAQPGRDEAQRIWKGVGCDTLFAGTGSDARNTWWYRVFATSEESGKKADGEIEWEVLSGVKGNKPTAAFALDCSAESAGPSGDGSSTGVGGRVVLPGWWVVVSPILAVHIYRLVEWVFV